MREMPEDRWDRIEEIFHAAQERPTGERAAFLDSVCAGDVELRREIESLLSESKETVRFMESPAGGLSIGSLHLPSLEGRRLNHYLIGQLVGSGGMAEVYRARDTKLGRDVAIKVLNHLRLVDPERLDPVYREARVLASLNHPNIAAIYGIEEADGLCGLVLELVEGESLAEQIQRGPLGIPDAFDKARQVIAGLQAAHARGIIHRDLKPANIKIAPDGAVKLVDFGLAKLLGSLDTKETIPDISQSGMVLGTVAYMSPEQARGRPIDARTDVWAFGCVLFEMLAGKPAFRGDTPTDIIVKIASEEPDWNEISKIQGADSPEIEHLIRRCIQKDPSARYSSVGEIAGRLEALRPDSNAYRPSSPDQPSNEDSDFVLPQRPALPLFMLVQVGYMVLYAAAMYHIDAVTKILVDRFQASAAAASSGTLILAMCGIAIRLYLISAVGWRHPQAGRKFNQLFPLLLVFDGIWAASPLLLSFDDRFGLALGGVVLLAYVPFAQRTLMRALYPKGL